MILDSIPPDDGVEPVCYVQTPHGGVVGAPDNPTGTVISVPGLQGPAGPQGPAGQSTGGTEWWYGVGAPTMIPGSKAGDFYMDTSTGVVYELS